MRPSSSRLALALGAGLLVALASPVALAQRDVAPPAPRSPSPVAPDLPGLNDTQLAQVEAIIERSVARTAQAQRDAAASLAYRPAAIAGTNSESAAYPSSQTVGRYALARPMSFAATQVEQAAPTTFVLVQEPQGLMKKTMAHVGAKLTSLSQPRIRSMALAPTAPAGVLASLPSAAKAAPVTPSPQNFGVIAR